MIRCPAIGPTKHWRWIATMPLLLFVLNMTGCQSNAQDRPKSDCPLSPGMDTEQLSACGCFPMSNNSGYSGALTTEDENRQSASVTIITYLCPLGRAGVARVVVINGISKDIYY